MIGAVILAAGASTRFGSPKQLLFYEGEPLVRRAAKTAQGSGLNPVVVVVGSDADAVVDALAPLENISIVRNPSWESGLASSLAAGVRFVRDNPDCDGALVLLADQPLVDETRISALRSAFDQDHRIVAAEYNGTLGVPAIFGREHFESLMQLKGDVGAGPWLRSRSDVTRVQLNVAALDVDTPADAEALQRSTPL